GAWPYIGSLIFVARRILTGSFPSLDKKKHSWAQQTRQEMTDHAYCSYFPSHSRKARSEKWKREDDGTRAQESRMVTDVVYAAKNLCSWQKTHLFLSLACPVQSRVSNFLRKHESGNLVPPLKEADTVFPAGNNTSSGLLHVDGSLTGRFNYECMIYGNEWKDFEQKEDEGRNVLVGFCAVVGFGWCGWDGAILASGGVPIEHWDGKGNPRSRHGQRARLPASGFNASGARTVVRCNWVSYIASPISRWRSKESLTICLTSPGAGCTTINSVLCADIHLIRHAYHNVESSTAEVVESRMTGLLTSSIEYYQSSAGMV
ncbi:hypothetical protein OBBRIDRAFT_858427, partial [Obba rivulosa]